MHARPIKVRPCSLRLGCQSRGATVVLRLLHLVASVVSAPCRRTLRVPPKFTKRHIPEEYEALNHAEVHEERMHIYFLHTISLFGVCVGVEIFMIDHSLASRFFLTFGSMSCTEATTEVS